MRSNVLKLSTCGLVLLVAQSVAAQERERGEQRRSNYPPRFPEARAEVYRTVGDVKLKLFIFTPPKHRAADRRPAILFFFGGGFRQGSPAQFEKHCEYFASRGMVAITADYRVSSRHGTTPADSVQDGRAAIRWVRTHAGRLGIDPHRIVASGGSAGGLIAACVGVIPDRQGEGEKPVVASTPDAMVLFNPAIMGKSGLDRTDRSGRPSFTKEIMPYYHVRKGLPPSIQFFGTEDRLLAGAREFHEAARASGNRSELKTWEGVGHGFFNIGRSDNKHFVATIRAADEFLASLGYLKGEPTIDAFAKRIGGRRRAEK